MLLRRTGDLISMAENGDFDIVVHGCNCQNTMGSGIAGQLKKRHPLVYEADCEATRQWKVPVAKLGNFSTAVINNDGNPFVVVNAYTQVNYLPRGVDHFEYEAFYVILRKLEVLAKPKVRFGFPMIGCGLAGGDETVIVPLIEGFAERATKNGSTVTLVEYVEG